MGGLVAADWRGGYVVVVGKLLVGQLWTWARKVEEGIVSMAHCSRRFGSIVVRVGLVRWDRP